MTKTTLITPKFLTKQLAQQAVETVLAAIMKPSPIGELLKRQACHIVILVPAMKDDREAHYPDWPDYPITPVSLYEHSLGDRRKWTGDYESIARCKALQLWHGRNDDRTDVMPHLLFSGDAPYYGGVQRHGIVVTCSGVQPWFDKMIAGMIAEVIVAIAYNAWMTGSDKLAGVDWLT